MKKMSLIKNLNLTQINDWYEAASPHSLADLFDDAFGNTGNVFAAIFVAIRHNPENETQQATETYDYYNVGFSDQDIAKYFNTKYSLNYFCYKYDIQSDYRKLKERVSAIYYANKYKYMKLIETLGYRYNPLYNVDGIELYSRAESIGDAKNTRQPEGTIKTETGTENNGDIGRSESIYYKNPYNNNSEQATVVDSKTAQSAITSKQTYENDYKETMEYKNIPANNYAYNSQTGKWEENGVFTVAAADNAFGTEFNGAERYYAEKKIRQGNIGVTKSTELLQSQRDIVRFNILDEFFKDLEPAIVVGVY